MKPLCLDAKSNGRLIINDFTSKDSLIVDGEVFKSSDVLEGGIDLPSHLLINPVKINGF